MAICSQCSNPTAPGTLSYLGDPLCQECADAERDDLTNEARAEAWARENAAPGQHYVRIDDLVYAVWPGDGRDWTAVLVCNPPDGIKIAGVIK